MHSAATLDLIGGAQALDFANTAGGRGTPLAIEYLHNANDVIDWAEHSKTLSPGAARRLRSSLGGDTAQARLLVERAIDLRETIYRSASSLVHAKEPRKSDLDMIVGIVGDALRKASLRGGRGQEFAVTFDGAPIPEAVLGPIALSALDLLRTGRLDRLKQCPGEDCGWLFVDTSKNGSRRWCDMTTCGNRAKGARHRTRASS